MTAIFAIAPITPQEIQERLYEAVRTLDQVPDPQKVMGYVCSMLTPVPSKQDHWAEAVQEIGEAGARQLFANSAIKSIPTPDAIDRMLPTLKWLTWVGRQERNIIHARAYDVAWWKIGVKLRPRRSDKTVKRQHDDAISAIFNELNNSVDAIPKVP